MKIENTDDPSTAGKLMSYSLIKCDKCGESYPFDETPLNHNCQLNILYHMSITMGLMIQSLQEIERVVKEVADSMLGEEEK